MSSFENINFWMTLFSKMVPNFWWSVWTSTKIKSKNYFEFTDFFAKINSLLTYVRKTPPMRSHYYACSSLTNFESDVHAMTGNGNQVNLLKIAWQNSWNHIKWSYYWQVLAIWNYCAAHSGNGGLTGARYITNKSENTCNLIVLVLPSLIYYIY